MEKICGVYQIKNKLTGERYIGGSTDIYNRWAGHKCRLRRGYHHSQKLQSTYNMCGEDILSYAVLLICPENDLLKYEQAYLDRGNCAYNTALYADCPNRDREFTEEHKNNLSDNHADISGENNPMYGKHHTKETIEKIREKKLNLSSETRRRMSESQKKRWERIRGGA